MPVSDTKRLNKILIAVTLGASKDDFTFESDDERDTWDRLVVQVERIKANGQMVWIPNE